MKTIYNPILQRLETKVPELTWVDLERGQLDTNSRPPVQFPCALVGIDIDDANSITDTLQDCKATITVRLVFDTVGRTAGNTPAIEREKSLQVYDTIANVYKALQGFYTEHFDCLSRKRQGKEKSRHGYFQYRYDFSCEFEDLTAEG